MFCNETSEYGMLFEGNRIKPYNIPGRMLVQIDKVVFEGQSYLAFEGEKEFERVREIKNYVEKCNEQWKDSVTAKKIPEIPAVLSSTYLFENFDIDDTNEDVPLGLNYETVSPIYFNIKENKLLVISGRKDSYRVKFAKSFISSVIQRMVNVELYILDDLQSKWSDYEFNDKTEFYSNNAETMESLIEELGQRLKSRYDNTLLKNDDGNVDDNWILLVVENNDVITEISKNKKMMPIMKDIVDKYYEMNVLVMFTNVTNSIISFNSPELLKMIKENKTYIVFDDVANIKLADISMSVIRKNSKSIDKNDAYYISDSELKKVKVII